MLFCKENRMFGFYFLYVMFFNFQYINKIEMEICVKSYNSNGKMKDFIGIDYLIVGGKRKK